MVNPIQRPHVTTATHSRMDNPPASLAGSGSAASFSQRGKSLALMPWKTTMFRPAAQISKTLARK